MSLWTLIYALVHSHVGTGRCQSPNCSHKVESMQWSNISWYAEEFRVPFTGTKGPSWAPEKQPHTVIPPPNFTLGTMQSDKYCSTGNRQTQFRPSDHQHRDPPSGIGRQWHRSGNLWHVRGISTCLHMLMYKVYTISLCFASSLYVYTTSWLSCFCSNRFHFGILSLTVDCGIFRSEETSRLDLLHRLHPIKYHAGIHWAP